MPFRLHRDARHWFRHIEKQKLGAAPLFDIYYLCAMQGIMFQRLEDHQDSDTSELVDYFPADYGGVSKPILAYFLMKECERNGVRLDDRSALNRHLALLLRQDTPSHLTDYGMRQFNKYSYGGFLRIRENRMEEPHDFGAFLAWYAKQAGKVRNPLSESAPAQIR